MEHGTWKLVEQKDARENDPNFTPPLPVIWVYKLKTDAEGLPY